MESIISEIATTNYKLQKDTERFEVTIPRPLLSSQPRARSSTKGSDKKPRPNSFRVKEPEVQNSYPSGVTLLGSILG